MTEDFLQYIWRYGLFNKESLTTTGNEKIEILSLGELNTNAGPDFFNAKIKIDDTTWAGNVEIHLNASDWLLHQHQKDKAYNNVILHVVYNADQQILRQNKTIVPCLELKFDHRLFDNYAELQKNNSPIACNKEIKQVDTFVIEHWLNSLMVERLENKSQSISDILLQNKNNWEETFYRILSRNFGFNLNAEPFEILARSLPLNYLAKHKNNLLQIEALLFGQAGFLAEPLDDEYYQKLQKEYIFLKQKFNLIEGEKHLWKFLRLRPSNFPTIRIAQFAKLIHQSSGLFSKILETNNIEELYQFFDVSASSYWNEHFVFGKTSKKSNKNLGKTAADIILINTIIPFLFLYGKNKDQQDLMDKALGFLDKIKAENNAIINQWKDLNMNITSAFYSQAYIQLRKNYCNTKKCLHCMIGNKIIVNDKTRLI